MQHDLTDWQYEVANGDTRLGFAEWLLHNRTHQGDDGYECDCTDGRHYETPDDTPAIDTSFHDNEMNID